MKTKSASLHWEFMFTRAMHKTPDMIKQHQLLNWVSGEVDGRRLRTTVSKVFSLVTAETLREAHRMVEAGSMRARLCSRAGKALQLTHYRSGTLLSLGSILVSLSRWANPPRFSATRPRTFVRDFISDVSITSLRPANLTWFRDATQKKVLPR